MTVDAKGIQCRCECAGHTDAWTIPKTVVRRKHKAVSISALFGRLAQQPIAGCRLGRTNSNDPEFLLVPRAANGVERRISKSQAGSGRRALPLAIPRSPLCMRFKSVQNPCRFFCHVILPVPSPLVMNSRRELCGSEISSTNSKKLVIIIFR